MTIETYAAIGDRTGFEAWMVAQTLKRGEAFLCLEGLGDHKELPSRQTKTMTFRRYEALARNTTPLAEGVTPVGKHITNTDVQVTLNQYGDFVTVTDQVMDFHPDQVVKEYRDVIGQQSHESIEEVRFNVVRAGTNVRYANGATRTAVNTAVSRDLLRRCRRDLARQNALALTSMVNAGTKYNTHPVKPSFWAVVHPDLNASIRDLPGFVDCSEYGSQAAEPGEIGSVEYIRFKESTIIQPWADGGGAAGSMISTTGTSADVYPIIIFAKHAWASTTLKGGKGITPILYMPKPSDSDKLAQRGHVGWKTYFNALILNDAWLIRAEVACPA
jgi:N4-gp56 family major capsid protein